MTLFFRCKGARVGGEDPDEGTNSEPCARPAGIGNDGGGAEDTFGGLKARTAFNCDGGGSSAIGGGSSPESLLASAARAASKH